jgi:hypothetical protein
MRIPVMIAPVVFALTAAGLMTAGVAQAATGTTKAQARLTKALEGRIAGKPIDCIFQNQIRSSEIIDRTAILYTVGRTIYVNTPPSGADFLNSGDILVTDTHSSQLCSVDSVKLLDQSSRMMRGSVGLGQFVPYAKPAA